MKNLKANIAAKSTAVVLSFISVAITAISVCSIFLMAYNNFYNAELEPLKKKIMTDIAETEVYNLDYVYYAKDLESKYENSNFYYKICDESGNVVATNYKGEEVITEATVATNNSYSDNYDENDTNDELKENITYTIYVAKEMKNPDRLSMLNKLIDLGYTLRYWLIAIAIISAVISLVTIIFLFCAAGYKEASENPTLNYVDKLPFDIYTVLMLFAAILSYESVKNVNGLALVAATAVTVLTVDYFLGLSYILSIATRIKTRTLFKNTVIYRVLKFIFSNAKKLFKFISKSIAFVWKAIITVIAILLFEYILMAFSAYNLGMITFWWFIISLVTIAITIYISIVMQKIKTGGKKISEGNLEYKIDTNYMLGEFKDFSESLNNVNAGLQVAVNEKIKSERFKTELITNVSHDIKTPLTSIINYVDLVKKEKSDNQNINQYIDVLDRQTKRLKKLIEDLVEASKASTGNLAVNFTKCELPVLLSQTIGEFDDRLKKCNLIPVLKMPDYPVEIMADGRHLWRVFDNLLSNICKYSQEGTRVYLDLIKGDGKVNIIFRNVSKYELNVSSDELMERFVRGDKSRNTEGSGLGLSIAKSLVELQNGQMNIFVDGDLFKVTLTFKEI